MNNQLLNPNQIPANNLQESELSVSALLSNLRRKWKPSVAIAMTVFAWVTFSNLKEKPIYQSSMRMWARQESSAIGYQYFSYRNINTEIEFLKSPQVLEKAVEILKTEYPSISIGEIGGGLSIATTSVPDIISISYTHREPEKTKKVLDALSEVYQEYSVQRQRKRADKGLEFIEYQLPKAKRELEEVTNAIREFQERYDILNLETYAHVHFGSKDRLENKIEDLELKLKLTKEERERRKQQLRESGYIKEVNMADIVVTDDGYYRRLDGLLNEGDIKTALAETQYKEIYPELELQKIQKETLSDLLSKRKNEVLENVETPTGLNEVEPMTPLQRNLAIQIVDQQRQVSMMETQLNTFLNLQSEVEEKVEQAPELQEIFEELKREQRIKESTVNFLINKLRDFSISQAQEASPWQVIQPAGIPGSPISPNVRRSITSALMAAVLTAIGTALILDLLDQRIKRIEEVKELTRVPLLGVIPKVGQPFVKLNDDSDSESQPETTSRTNSYYPKKDASFTEAIRGLGINLRYLLTNTGTGKTLAITSSRPGEGKSTISYNLGLILAELGLRVLIVDGDMRKPSIHKLSSQNNEFGLSTAITTNRHYLEMTHRGKLENLEILTSGPTPPNPVALLDSEKFDQLINQWQEIYDYVLIDTPPLGIGADTITIANKVDSVILSVGMEKTTRKMVKNSMDTFISNQIKVGGCMANFIDSKHDYYNYYNYYYYYYNQGERSRRGNNGMQRFLSYFRRR